MTYLIFHITLSALMIVAIVVLCAKLEKWSNLWSMIITAVLIPYIMLFVFLREKYKSHEEKKEREKIAQLQITKEVKKEQIEILYFNYQGSFPESTKDYPIVRIPKNECVIRTHRLGRTKRRGYKEESFQLSIQKYFGNDFEILGNVYLNTGKETRPFEPDIAIINRKTNKNIRIDIEIDEPYSAIGRQPTHCNDEDCMRDIYFTNRGWIVVRFSEYQVHTQELSCLRFLALVIQSIFPNSYKIPSDLLYEKKVIRENLWDIIQAQKWEKEKYREKYLEINAFGYVPNNMEIVGQDWTEQELEEERFLLKPTPPIKYNSIPCGSQTTQKIVIDTPYNSNINKPITPSTKTDIIGTTNPHRNNDDILNSGTAGRKQSTNTTQLTNNQNYTPTTENKLKEFFYGFISILMSIIYIILFALIFSLPLYLLSLIFT